jgi:hypothetical protein
MEDSHTDILKSENTHKDTHKDTHRDTHRDTHKVLKKKKNQGVY